MKAVVTIMLMTAVICVAGCKSKNVSGGRMQKHEYVDLGLPSGLLWAACNVGANKPEEYGDYFAWGETQPKSQYDWDTYKYCKFEGANEEVRITKYCWNSRFGYNGFVDNLFILDKSDDAATENWGAGWFTPTRSQWEELYENTTNEWISKNGIQGRLFSGSNGNSIFIPAAGYCLDKDYRSYAGLYGCYWSSSSSHDFPETAWEFYFYADPNIGVATSVPFYGMPVRPVRLTK